MTRTLGKSFIKEKGLKNPIQPSTYPTNWNKRSSDYRKRRNYTCELCGVDCSDHTKLVDAHHKDGDKTNCKDENLECLCKYHHSKKPFHGHYKIKEEDMQDLRKLWEEQNIPHDKYNFHRDDDHNKEAKLPADEFHIAILDSKMHFYYCRTLTNMNEQGYLSKCKTISKMDLKNKENLGANLTWCKDCIDILCHNGKMSQGHILNQIAEHGDAEELMDCLEADYNDNPSAVQKIQNFITNTIRNK